MFDHVNIPVTNLTPSTEFYKEVLKPLGLQFLGYDDDAAGFGRQHWEFGVYTESSAFSPIHLAFRAPTKEVVDSFYSNAINAGATDHGAPGLRPQYGVGYYAAYVLDLDGHNIEVLCR